MNSSLPEDAGPTGKKQGYSLMSEALFLRTAVLVFVNFIIVKNLFKSFKIVMIIISQLYPYKI